MDKFQHEVSILLSLHDYEVNVIINADETPINIPGCAAKEHTIELNGASEVIALNTGSEKNRFTAMMSITSNGMFLLCSFVGVKKSKDVEREAIWLYTVQMIMHG